MHMTTLALLVVAVLSFTSCSSTSTPPPDVGSARIDYTKGVPGGVITQTFKTAATVTAIDQTKRTATLLGADGKQFQVSVGPEAVNFDQIRVGDRVVATVTQKIVAALGKNGINAGEGAGVAAALAAKGDQPGVLVAGTMQVTAKVSAIDSSKRTVTLRFEDGSTQTFPIRDDVNQSRIKLGEQVVFRVTEMTAVRVEKPE
jgi:translation elongation factor P/translation initiation factor 5A